MAKTVHFVFLVLAVQLACVNGRAASGCSDHGADTYHAAPADRSNTTQLEASRAVTGKVNAVEVNVGAGELKIESAPAGSPLRVRVTSPGADRTLSEYLRDFDLAGGTARLSVCVPNNYHATVTLLVPAPGSGKSEVNLGAGNLTLDMEALPAGEREVNVGAGNATILLNGTHDYATLKVNVGMGQFEDQRPGGSKASLVITRELTGSGRAEVEVNVGAGRLLLKPGAE